MNDYMQALHQRFCREPTHPELERALDDTYHALRENITRQDQELLLRAQDLEIELREETSLASFIAGFRLGMGIAGEIEPSSAEMQAVFSMAGISKSGPQYKDKILPADDNFLIY